jgi:hypothetical protein
MLRIRRAGLPAQARSVFAGFRFPRDAIVLAIRLLGADCRTVVPRCPRYEIWHRASAEPAVSAQLHRPTL